MVFSCQKVEKIEKVGTITPKLVVNSVAEDGDVFEFVVSKSLSSLDNAPIKNLKNAKIKLYREGLFVEDILWDNIDQTYYSKAKAEYGKAYKIEVSAPGFKDVSAACTVPRPAPILAKTLKVKGKNTVVYNWGSGSRIYGSYTNAELTFNFQDEGGVKNGYLFTVEEVWDGPSSGSGRYTPRWNYNMPGLEYVYDYQSSMSGGGFYFLDDALYDGKNVQVKLSRESDEYSSYNYRYDDDSVVAFQINLYTLSTDLFHHDYSVRLYNSTQDDFFQEPVQIYSNILNGYGVFGARSFSTADIPFP
ncbi:MAG: DUF4249 domain-containing protein [Bacteroidetes bacterium]|nr:DUF4249 domain-containing protein [Bacteroidota bacterium]